MFNKFDNLRMFNFPEEMKFPSEKKIEYKIKAKIEHTGSRSSGHYWTHCIRVFMLKHIIV